VIDRCVLPHEKAVGVACFGEGSALVFRHETTVASVGAIHAGGFWDEGGDHAVTEVSEALVPDLLHVGAEES